ncbi:hypothetical protein C8F04DRAFT_1039596 [Mycena alexandri]|uniref:Uncharacterized protein n=1 Tax=Mycena alexandri TaxID=1745969 RepID=A0AAD6X1K2_9AGAR|nr:hypothetical protein C8F04DRAFT_1015582 [Mycena alexandri]KAJ7033217.1 hypothetical protein C8F04DRAFT_1039596 [Mycena alexandri]
MSKTMLPKSPQKSPQKPHPHSVDLLRNRDLSRPLTSFDGNVGAWAQIGPEHYFITSNADYIPALPSIETPHRVYLRTDMRYGTDDPTLWPQQWAPEYCHLPFIWKKGAHRELDVMWWNASREDFVVGSAVTRGLGRLKCNRFSKLLLPANQLVERCKELKRTSPALYLPLFDQLMQQIVMWLEQLESLPTTFPKMVFAITSLQRAILELDALHRYMTVYKARIDNFLTPAPTTIAPCIGAFTSTVSSAQQLYAARIPFWFVRPANVFDRENILKLVDLEEPRFGLPDPDAHGEGAPPFLYTGNSTVAKIGAIQEAAVRTPWYRDPFENGFTRSQSPPPTSATTPRASSVASTSSSAARASGGPAPHNRQQQLRYNPYPAQAPAKSAKKAGPAKLKGVQKPQRDKFITVTIPEMPPSVNSMALALSKVDREIVPYTSDSADKAYVLPEPALLVNTTPERRHRNLHHWNLLSDGFLYMLTDSPQLLGPQDWRDILDGKMTKRGAPDSREYRRSEKLQDIIRPALDASSVEDVKGFPVPVDQLPPPFSLAQIHEIVWQVAETSFRFEFCALDTRAHGKRRLAEVKHCFAGHMLVGVPLEMGKRGWASTSLEERHRYVVRTATLMLDWTTKSTLPNIIRRVAEHHQWSPANMEALETAVCCFYMQSFWEYFGRAAIVPLRLDHDLEREEGEL